ncbi:MAG: sterol desaturase family protein [Flavobacteriaceae bacterium]|nr:sterol desaturase family protein [Flavobacteriaceae bacterium]
MNEYLLVLLNVILDTARWTWNSMTFQVDWYTNYFWGLVLISLLVWLLEIVFPWRKSQGIIRKDFWLDGFYMFFNFFIFSVAINGFYQLISLFFQQLGVSEKSLAILNLSALPMLLQLFVFFVVLDFVQWLTHIMLHRFSFLWKFHQVHHSVKEMGFSAHLRYHWMENILYKPLKTFGVMLLGGFEPEQAYIVHFIAISIGHFNHSNIKITWGPFKYLVNNPVMHLYHHAYHFPEEHPNGVNFGISLSVWDYIFKTNHIAEDSGTIKLGFPGDDQMPKNFMGQLKYGFKSANHKDRF